MMPWLRFAAVNLNEPRSKKSRPSSFQSVLGDTERQARCPKAGRPTGKKVGGTQLTGQFPNTNKISLYVNRDNKNARSFYERQGFKQVSEEKVMMGSFEFNDLIMSKTLRHG